MVPLPPLAEQSRIVTRVEELMRLCDALQAKARLEATQHPPLAEQSRIVARVACLHALCADLRQRLTAARTQQALLAQVLVTDVQR